MAQTWTCVNASGSEVQSKINGAAAGDTIIVPAGTEDWVGVNAVTVDRALTFIGAGIGVTNIALSGTEGSSLYITKQTGTILFTGFSFNTVWNGGNHPCFITGSWTGTNPVIFWRNYMRTDVNTFCTCDVPGGVIWSYNTFSSDYNSGPFTVKDPTNSQGSWTSNPTMGTDDTSGLLNHYFEDNTVEGSTNGVFDADDGCRIVIRNNSFTYGMFNSHGYDTSSWGLRHFEIYDNTYSRGDPDHAIGSDGFYLGNVVQVIWIRGGTGCIYNNSFEDITSGTWGAKPIIRISGRGYGQPTLIGLTCGTVTYPQPRQPGQSYVGGSRVTDPIYFWGNTPGGWTVPEADDFNWNDCSNPWSTFFQWGRDAINQSISGGSAKAGYTAYTYPHPLVPLTIETVPTPTITTARFPSQTPPPSHGRRGRKVKTF